MSAILRRLTLIILPALFAVASLNLIRDRGPMWLGTNSDPSYQYLFSSLLLANDVAPYHTDHPGTPAQLIGLAVLSATNSRADMQAFNDAVLTNPEQALANIITTFLAVVCIAFVASGVIVLQSTGSLAMALTIQAVPLLHIGTYHGTIVFTPEGLLIAIMVLIVALILAAECRDVPLSPQYERLIAVTLGVLAAIGVTTRLTFAPLCVLVLIVQRTPRLVGWTAGAMLAGLAACTAVIWSELPRTFSWFSRLAGHKGVYAEGATGFVDWATYPGNLCTMLTIDRMVPVVLIVSVAVGLRTRGTRFGFLLLILAAIQLAGLALIAKHPAARYALPLVISTALNAALMMDLAGPKIVHIAWIGCVVLAAFGALTIRDYTRLAAHLKESAAEQIAMKEKADSLGVRVDYFRSTSPEFALHFGNSSARFLFSTNLMRLYPDRLFLNRWNGNFEVFGGWIKPEHVPRGRPLVLHGSADSFLPKAEWKAVPLHDNGKGITIHRVEWSSW